MQAIAIDRNGGPELLVPRDVPTPQPREGEALVKLAASGVNFIDVYYRTGTYPSPGFPFVLGQEGAGVVEAVGAGVSEFSAGDRVAYQGILGSYAQYAAVPAARLVRVPEGVHLTDAAAIMLQGMTAHYLCNDTFPLRAGMTALVHAGAGGVGLLLTQLAAKKGARVITTVSTPEKAELSKRAGAALTIDYTKDDFAKAVRDATGGEGAHVVYDSVGKTTWEKSLDSLRPRGYFVLFGGSSGPVPPFDLQLLNRKGSLFATRPTLVNYVSDRADLERRSSELFGMLADGTLDVRIGGTYPLAEARRAHEDLEGRKTTGKLLLLMP